MAENHGHSTWIAVFLKSNDDAFIELNDLFSTHLHPISHVILSEAKNLRSILHPAPRAKIDQRCFASLNMTMPSAWDELLGLSGSFSHLYCKASICRPNCSSKNDSVVGSLVMENYSQPPPGKISEHGHGIGAPSREEVERRAREIAMLNERNPAPSPKPHTAQAPPHLTPAENKA